MASKAIGFGESPQNRKKFNGIEFDGDLGLNIDEAFYRNYDPQTGRWWQIDPKVEESQENISPYASMFNNPLLHTDPMGDVPGDYYNEQGQHIGNDGIDDHKNYVIKTTQTTTQLYGSGNSPEKGNSNPISQKDAAQTEKEIKAGNFGPSVMKNVVEVASTKVLNEMQTVVSKDNGKGGTSPNNNAENGGLLFNGTVVPTPTGPVKDPSKGSNASVSSSLLIDFHSHPSGTKKITLPGGVSATATWAQPPSKTDITGATRTNYVFGMGNGKLYIYNKTGVLAIIPQKSIK